MYDGYTSIVTRRHGSESLWGLSLSAGANGVADDGAIMESVAHQNGSTVCDAPRLARATLAHDAAGVVPLLLRPPVLR